LSDAVRVVRVAIPKPLPQLFDYALAEGQPVPVAGARVRVPFGRQQLTGVCVAVDPPDPHPDPKPLTAVLDRDNPFGAELFGLASWMADYYHHPLGEVLGTLMPAEVRRGAALEDAYQRPCVSGWALTTPRPPAGRAPRQRGLVEFLEARDGSASADDLAAAGFSKAVIRGAASKGIIVRHDQPLDRSTVIPAHRLQLNEEQDGVLRALRERERGFSATLLQGVTGSGKTEIYLRLIEAVLARGLQVLVLVPEIALTPQTLQRFRHRFGTATALHSGMTDANRLQAWLGCRAGDVDILIGTRSAVLTPFRRLGLIVVDEEHDASFKQQDGLRYSARDVAVKRAQGLGIPLLLGSATPSFESLVNAWSGRYRHLALHGRAGGASMPAFHLLDIRGHTLNDGISDALVHVMRRHLAAGGQVLLFLNRRGFAPSFLCTGCGWQATCPHCDMRMTLHRHPSALICHHCNQRARVPTACPSCGSSALLGVGLGTQRTEAGVAQLFPDTPVHRIDRDTARSQRRLEAQLDAIQAGGPAILIGTQMLAKGHHFPNVTLVGVINADSGFLSADFRAPERTAQLIVQVAGRAGRAERPGEVWIQTYQPENPTLQSLIQEGYEGFARRELEHRRAAGLPPYRPMALLRAEGPDAAQARAFLAELQQSLQRTITQHGAAGHDPAVEVLGPVAAPIQRVANRYRFQLMVLADSRRALHETLRRLDGAPAHARTLRWSIDIDPYDAF
jgi:primosomal protein N' (replication factor Y) (superfamily II helicase)